MILPPPPKNSRGFSRLSSPIFAWIRQKIGNCLFLLFLVHHGRIGFSAPPGQRVVFVRSFQVLPAVFFVFAETSSLSGVSARPCDLAGNAQRRNACMRSLHSVADTFFVGDDAHIVPRAAICRFRRRMCKIKLSLRRSEATAAIRFPCSCPDNLSGGGRRIASLCSQ